MISVKVNGINQYIRKLETFSNRILPSHVDSTTDEILDRIRDLAIQNLNSDIKWGHSLTEPRITDKENWHKVDVGSGGPYSSKMLVCDSPHAFIVEYGAIGGMVIRQPGEGPPFSIGNSQGQNIGPRYSFKLQEGKHFLERAIDQVLNGGELEGITYKHLTDAIRSSGL